MDRKKLLKEIDKARREYIRERDYNFQGYANCISCKATGTNMDVGHYYTRSNDWTTDLGGDERNVNLQCVPCNSHKRGNPRGYVIGLIEKYGENVIMELEKKRNTKKYWKIKDLEIILKYYQDKLKVLKNKIKI